MTSDADSKICVLGCALACGVELACVLSPSRERRAVMARIAAAVMLREQGMSLPQIGRRLGFRHNTSVLYYLRRAKQIPESIETIMACARESVARLEHACERAQRRHDSGAPLDPDNPRPKSTPANGSRQAMTKVIDYERADGLVCRRCGLRLGPHENAAQCISALRELIAHLENALANSRAGGRRRD